MTSDGIHYKDLIIKAKFEEDSEGQVVIKTPFQRYSEEVWVEKQNVTYSYRNDKSLIGKECVVFTSCIAEHPVAPSEEVKAFSDANTLGKTIKEVKILPEFTTHFKESVVTEELIDL